MNGHFSIQIATLDDIDNIVRMRLSLQQHMFKNNSHLWQMSRKKVSSLPTFYRSVIEHRDSQLLIAKDGKSRSIIGMAIGRICVHDEYVPNKSGRIDDVWIEPNYRRKGLATRLVSELLEFFKVNHIGVIILEYAKGNIEAEAIWERFGFEPVLTIATANLSDLEIISKEQKT